MNAVGAVANILGETVIGEGGELSSWYSKQQDLRLEIARNAGAVEASAETLERIRVNGATEITKISDILHHNCSNDIKNILSNSYIIDLVDPSSIANFPKDLGVDLLVTKDGQGAIVNQGGMSRLILGAHLGVQNNSVERNNQINELTEQSESLEAEVAMAKEKLSEKEDQLEQYCSERDEINGQLRSTEEDYIRAKAEIDSKLKNYESNQSRIDILSNRKQKISVERLELLEKVEVLNNSTEEMNSEVIEKNEILEAKEEELLDLESIYTEKRDSHAAKKRREKHFLLRLALWKIRFKILRIKLSALRHVMKILRS